tara:strand:+ start:452 stop:748 length:297 start_codon:yes stop_codon:yes gene_type:complete
MGKDQKREAYIDISLIKPQLGWVILSRTRGATLATVMRCGPGTPYTGMPGVRPVLVHVGELVPCPNAEVALLGKLDADTDLLAVRSDDIPFVVMPKQD